MVTLTGLISRTPGSLPAARSAGSWALGHSASVISLGTAVVVLDLRPPAAMTRLFAFGVGLTLIVIGGWMLRAEAARRGIAGRFGPRAVRAPTPAGVAQPMYAHAHREESDAMPGNSFRTPSRSRRSSAESRDARRPFWVGTVHGLGGHHILALLPLTLVGSTREAGFYLAAFCTGTGLAALTFAVGTAVLLRSADRFAPSVAVILRAATAVASLTIGAVWIVRALRGPGGWPLN